LFLHIIPITVCFKDISPPLRYKVGPWSQDVAQRHNFEPWLVVKFVAMRPEGMPCQNPAGKSNQMGGTPQNRKCTTATQAANTNARMVP
jgi:hypothetical protein